MVHPDDAPGLDEHWQSCLASGAPADAEARMRRFDGVYRWFLFRANPLRDEDGAIIKWYGTNIDIEDRRQADEKLRRSEIYLTEAQRLSQTGSFSWRLDTDEIAFSEELYRILEFERNAVVTLRADRHAIPYGRIPFLFANIEQLRSGGDGEFDYENRLQMPDGRIKHMRTFGHVIHHPDGRRECLGAVQDVTQRHLSDEALANARSKLAHVARITSLGVLTASIAHEINQPLAAIITNGQTGLRWLTRPKPDIEKARELTKRVVEDARRASEIIDRIRAMATGQPAKQTRLSLDDIVEESMVFLRHEFQSKSTSVSLDLAAALPRVVGDRTQLQQVLVNLAVNAIQAMSESGAMRRRMLIRTILSDPESVCCIVEDSGPGIDQRRFPVFSIPSSTKTRHGYGVADLPVHCRST